MRDKTLTTERVTINRMGGIGTFYMPQRKRTYWIPIFNHWINLSDHFFPDTASAFELLSYIQQWRHLPK